MKAIACIHPKFFIGCRAGKITRFAVLDIDKNSRFHNQHSLNKLLKVLSTAGLARSSLYRSSDSGGWHLYIFFDEPINSLDLRKQLIKLLTLNDFNIAKGQLEIFPHPGAQNSLGLGLRLPLQPGFAWLDKQTLEIEYERSQLSATQALELFVDVLDADCNSYQAFRQLKSHVQELEQQRGLAQKQGRGDTTTNVISIRRHAELPQASDFTDFVTAVFSHLPPGIIVDNWYKGRLYHLNGLTGPSQRADAIECLGHYLFYGDPSRDFPALGYGCEKEREWAIREFLSCRHNGQSEEINRGRADALSQAERAVNWRPPHRQDIEPEKFTPAVPIIWVRANAKRQADARSRISNALEGLKSFGRYFATDELRKAAKCSKETLFKHKDIWEKDYEDLASGFFAIGTGEYNDVVGAGSPKTEPPSTSFEQDMPPGRLAARRIAYEISMRSARGHKQAQKTSLQSLEASESTWQGEVNRLTEKEPTELTVLEIKVLLVMLANYLAVAPCYESQSALLVYISKLKEQLAIEMTGPQFLVRPP